MAPPLALRFVQSAIEVTQLPPSASEVAVVGRSNVGKSTLINALAGRKALARVSNTPGRTQLINLFQLEEHGSVVDLPGYGYAAVSKKLRSGWPEMIASYLLERPSLQRVLVLVDGEIGPTKLDLSMLAWLRDHDLAIQVVATKADKVKAAQRDRRRQVLAAGCGVAPSEVVWVSAPKGAGVDELRGLVRAWLGSAG